MSPSRRLLFSLIAVTLGLSVIEGLLALIGIRPESYLPDPYVGFEGSSPLFVEWLDEQGDPWMRTDTAKRPLFNDQRFLRNKPEGTFRIF
ncbi:MAG: O-GlcNAc transferase, partial [Limisphaerales bacterium]